MDLDNIRRTYRHYALGYDLYFGALFQPGRRAVIERMNCRPGDGILEVGVGTGLSLPLYPPTVQVTAIDVSPEMLARARSRVQRHSLPHATLHCMDAEDMDFSDDSFDKSVAMYVMSVAPDPARLLNEMRRVTRAQGDIYIVNHFHNANPIVGGVERLTAPLSRLLGFHPDFSLDKFLLDTGLEIVEKTPVNLFGYWTLLYAHNNKQAARSSPRRTGAN